MTNRERAEAFFTKRCISTGALAAEFDRLERETIERCAEELELSAKSYESTAATADRRQFVPASQVGNGMAAACRSDARRIRALASTKGKP
jgi:hypothetical protein